MAHKDKILANLKAKHPKVQGSVIEFIADKLDSKVTTEADVDTAIKAFEEGPTSVEDIAALVGKEGDKRVTEALKKKTTTTKTEGEENEPVKVKTPDNGDDPLAKILEAVNGLGSRLEAVEKGKMAENATSKLHAKAKEAKIPLHLVPAVENEDGIDAAFQKATEAYNEVKQHLANEGFSQGKPPAGGNTSTKTTQGDAKAVSADITNFVNKQLAAKGITPTKTA